MLESKNRDTMYSNYTLEMEELEITRGTPGLGEVLRDDVMATEPALQQVHTSLGIEQKGRSFG